MFHSGGEVFVFHRGSIRVSQGEYPCFTGKVSPCQDGNQNCSTWADLGHCLTFPMTMATETCLLSCNWCPGDLIACCPSV